MSTVQDDDYSVESLMRNLKASEKQLSENPQSAGATRDVAVNLSLLARSLAYRGGLGDAEQAVGLSTHALQLFEQLLATDPGSADAKRDVLVCLRVLAQALAARRQGPDTDDALSCLKRALAIGDDVLRAEPESTDAMQNVSITLRHLAERLIERRQVGDDGRAIGYYERSLRIDEQVLRSMPESTDALHDISVTLDRLAGFLMMRDREGDAELALLYAERSLSIRERLLTEAPESSEAKERMLAGLSKLAGLLCFDGQTKDLERALDYIERYLELAGEMLNADPQSVDALQNTAAGLENKADVLERRRSAGDIEEALKCRERGLEIRDQLLQADPESREAVLSVADALWNLGDLLKEREESGTSERALSCYSRCLAVCERLLSAEPQSVTAKKAVAKGLEKLADLVAVRGKPDEIDRAMNYYERRLAIREELATLEPHSAEAMTDLSSALDDLAGLLIRRGQDGGADRALSCLERVVDIHEHLMALKNDVPPLQWNVIIAGAISILSTIDYAESVAMVQAWDVGRLAGYLGRALRVRERLLRVYPEAPDGQRKLLAARARLAKVEISLSFRPLSR